MEFKDIEFDKLTDFLKSELDTMDFEETHYDYKYKNKKYYVQLLKCLDIAREHGIMASQLKGKVMELVFIDELSLNEEEKAYLKSARDQIKANKSRKAELEAKIASMKSVIDEYQKSIDVLENDIYDFIQKHK